MNKERDSSKLNIGISPSEICASSRAETWAILGDGRVAVAARTMTDRDIRNVDTLKQAVLWAVQC